MHRSRRRAFLRCVHPNRNRRRSAYLCTAEDTAGICRGGKDEEGAAMAAPSLLQLTLTRKQFSPLAELALAQGSSTNSLLSLTDTCSCSSADSDTTGSCPKRVCFSEALTVMLVPSRHEVNRFEIWWSLLELQQFRVRYQMQLAEARRNGEEGLDTIDYEDSTAYESAGASRYSGCDGEVDPERLALRRFKQETAMLAMY
ncbi:hypothetical protein JKP88DRAFT_226536, partial [Tribonema minus]